MNNKGFTLVEFLAVIVIISLFSFFVSIGIRNSFSVTNKDAYTLTKNNVIEAANTYVKECRAGIVDCNIDFDGGIFYADDLIKFGYFNNLLSPIDGKDLKNCLYFKVKIDNGNFIINLVDECY